MSAFAHNLHTKSDATLLSWVKTALDQIAWIDMNDAPRRVGYRRWCAEIQELLVVLHSRGVSLSDKLCTALRFEGIDPTPPPNYKIPDLAPVLVW